MSDILKRARTSKTAYDQQFSWVYRAMFDGKWVISVQYLMWQGAEFSIAFANKQQADHILHEMMKYYAPKKKPEIRYGHGWSELVYDFEINNCLNPIALLEFAKLEYPHAELVFTPKKGDMLKWFFGDNVDKARKCFVFRNEDKCYTKRYSFIPHNETVQGFLSA